MNRGETGFVYDGDGVPDFVVQWSDAGDVIQRTRGISGVTGAMLWNVASPVRTRP